MDDCSQEEMRPSLNFSIGQHNMDYGDLPQKKIRTPRDPMSHRIIEKRRRDRMNNCLADLSQLIPSHVLKQGQGRIEKTEIIEMATRHICNLQNEIKVLRRQLASKGEPPTEDIMTELSPPGQCCQVHFSLGFKECRDEVMKFLVERQGHNAADPLCVNLLHHLQEQLVKNKRAHLKATHPVCPDNVDYCASTDSTPHNPSTPLNPASHPPVPARPQTPIESSRELLPDTERCAQVKDKTPEPDHQSTGLMRLSSATSNLRDLDKHLKTLLSGSADEKRQLWLEEMASDGQESQSSMSLSGAWGMRGDGHISMSTSSSGGGPTEEGRSSEPLSPVRQGNTYKFKNDIKLRFSADMLVGKPESHGSEDINSSTRDDSDLGASSGRGQCPTRGAHITSSDTTSYPGSDFSSASNPTSCSNGNSSNGNGSSSSSSLSDGNGNHDQTGVNPVDLANSVPGFALHPAGTYYIPVITPASQLVPFLQNYGASGFCHPISIPVNFGGPLISMQNIRVAQNHFETKQTFKAEPTYSNSSARRKKSHMYSSSRVSVGQRGLGKT